MDLDHAHGPAAAMRPPQHLDYSLVGEEASRAIERGLAEADWYQCPVGLIHEVAREEYLESHPNLSAVEFYLCGPPMMIKACTRMLDKLGVDPSQIAYDEF